jgi:hypothetical protein
LHIGAVWDMRVSCLIPGAARLPALAYRDDAMVGLIQTKTSMVETCACRRVRQEVQISVGAARQRHSILGSSGRAKSRIAHHFAHRSRVHPGTGVRLEMCNYTILIAMHTPWCFELVPRVPFLGFEVIIDHATLKCRLEHHVQRREQRELQATYDVSVRKRAEYNGHHQRINGQHRRARPR